MTGYSVKVLADSVAPGGERLTTVQATFPRFILAELNTHRMLSRNSASSRAIPGHKMRERVMSSPAMPVWWGAEQSGMQSSREVDNPNNAEIWWMAARKEAAWWHEEGQIHGLHKQIVNRVIEPWTMHTSIISATEWANFLQQRDTWPDPSQPPGPAQPEFAVLARMIREAMEASTPRKLRAGEWHLPLVETEDESSPLYVRREDVDDASSKPWEDHPLCAISAARCARVSYLTHEGKRDLRADLDLHDRLVSMRHWSPLEHVAQAMPDTREDDLSLLESMSSTTGYIYKIVSAGLSAMRWSGNFRGWDQYRKLFAGEHEGYAPGG